MGNYVIGLDYGTDSVRTLIVNAKNGEEVATVVQAYPRWMEGKYCKPEINQFRHHPLDYIEGLEFTIKTCLDKVPADVKNNIRAISVDTTGSTPCFVDEKGSPLSLSDKFSDNPNAMFILWKDHTAVNETAEINQIAKSWGGEDFTKYEGGVYSSEWFWSKALHILRTDEKVRESAYSIMELCDWIPALLSNIQDVKKVKRSRCAAGHKAMWHESWGGLPDEEFLRAIDPLLVGWKERLFTNTFTADVKVGTISQDWAIQLGLNENVAIGVGAFDAHMGAVGANIQPYSLVKIVGTSTCDVMVVSKEEIGKNLIEGICGQVNGSVIPNMIGLEAGQSSFGDVYAWFKTLLSWPIKKFITDRSQREMMEEDIIPELEKAAKKLAIDEDELISLDWFNGRRTPIANQFLKGAITGISLGSDAPRVYRSLIEATAYGARAINERFEDQGVKIEEIIAIGGISKKSDLVMQILSDVLNTPIKVARSDQTCALGAAMFAAVVGGIYTTVEEAQQKMNSGFIKEYQPIQKNSHKYDRIYKKYVNLGKFIENETMKEKT